MACKHCHPGRVDRGGPVRLIGNPMFAKLPKRFQWTLHNLIAHPLSEVLFQFGFEDAGNWVHDWSVPLHDEGTGRG